MSFSAPVWLAALALVPAGLGTAIWARRRARRYAVRFPAVATLQLAAGITESDQPKSKNVKPKYGLKSLRHAAASLFIEQRFSPKRVQEPVGMVDMVQVRPDLGTQPAAGYRVLRVASEADGLPVADLGHHATGVGAVMRARPTHKS